MKMRKITALLAIMTLLLTLWAPLAVSAEESAPATAPAAPAAAATDLMDAPLELLAALDNGDKLCAVYRIIIDAIRSGTEFVDFGGYTLTEQEQAILQSVVDATIPEGYDEYLGHSYCSVDKNYFYSWFYSWDLTAEQFDLLQSKVDEMTADLAGKSDFDKSLILYQRLIQANRYDFGDHDQTAYGALIEGTSVCAGYARSYQLLLQAVGIPCLYLTGTADNGYQIGGHAWNLVQLDGQWYYCDPTWDDFDNIYWGIPYTYLNIIYAEISADHFLDAIFEEWVPRSTATALNYFVYEGMMVESLTLDQIIALFKKHNPLPLKLIGDKESSAGAIAEVFYNNIDTIAKAMGVPGGNGWISYSSDYSTFELVLVLDHEHEYVYQISEPTCNHAGETLYACLTCGDRAWLTTAEPLGHTAADSWICDESGHAKSCIRCGVTMESDAHTYQGGVCTVCGYIDNACKHEYTLTVLITPSCEGYGWYHYTCQLCGDNYYETVPSLGHTTVCIAFDGDYHLQVCDVCGKEFEESPHTYTDDSDTDCDECGYQRQIALRGDADGNGKVNNRDLGLLQLYLNDDDLSDKPFDLAAVDLDGNGKINNRDLGLLQKLLNQ